MKTPRRAAIALGATWMALATLVAPRDAHADYDLSWHSIDSGGGASSGAGFTLTGSIGQPDAGEPMSSGTLSLIGGFYVPSAGLLPPGVPALAPLSLLTLVGSLLGTGLFATRHLRVRRAGN